MPIQHSFAGIGVADYGSALTWYERLFGRPPDVVVKVDEVMWQTTETSWVYVVEDAGRAGNALLTLLVDDLDECVAQLSGRGIDTGAIETKPGLYRRVAIVDAEGNRVAFGESLGRDS